jgi:hypothetical protein
MRRLGSRPVAWNSCRRSHWGTPCRGRRRPPARSHRSGCGRQALRHRPLNEPLEMRRLHRAAERRQAIWPVISLVGRLHGILRVRRLRKGVYLAGNGMRLRGVVLLILVFREFSRCAATLVLRSPGCADSCGLALGLRPLLPPRLAADKDERTHRQGLGQRQKPAHDEVSRAGRQRTMISRLIRTPAAWPRLRRAERTRCRAHTALGPCAGRRRRARTG